MMRTTATNAYAGFPYYYVVRGQTVEDLSPLTTSTTSAKLPDMKRRKNKGLDLGPSRVAIEAHHRKGGVHDDQKINHKRSRKRAKQALKERHE